MEYISEIFDSSKNIFNSIKVQDVCGFIMKITKKKKTNTIILTANKTKI